MSRAHNYKQLGIITIALVLSSLVCIGMLVLRAFYTNSLTFSFMIWNLFLAWIPFIIASGMYVVHIKKRQQRIAQLLLGGAWLAFFPNAPYLITDLMHISVLQASQTAPEWFDVLFMTSFAITGLLLGFVSLYFVQLIIKNMYSKTVGWIMVTVVLLLSSFGIYLGRFLRWNSWDVVSQPGSLAYDVLDRIINPLSHPRTILFTFLYFAFLGSTYLILYMLTRIQDHD